MFPAMFVVKYKTLSACYRASEMVHNGSRFWNVVVMDNRPSAVQSAVF